MKGRKPSITFTVILGYLLIATLAALAIWFIYSQVLKYTSMAEKNISDSRELYLVGEAATNLYEAESLSRRVIQTENREILKLYKAEIDSVRNTLIDLRRTYTDTLLKKEIDSINLLLSQKTANLEELLLLRQQEGNQSYYAKVISELQRVDENFQDPNYEERFKELEPHQRDILIKLLEYSEKENAEVVTTETLHSLVNSVKNVLSELEMAERRYREILMNKEDELLANEISLNSQLRNLLTKIENEERKASLARVEASQEIINRTSRIIAILGGLSLLVIFIFLFLVVKDVSRSQRYRQKLEDAKQYAESILKSKEQFMATVTHDLRSPLNTVVGYTNLLEKSELNKAQMHYLSHLKKSADFILHLVNDLLDLSKLEAGKMSVEKLAFNPRDLIEDTIKNAIPAEKWQTISVEINISDELNQPLISDPFRIKQILINLITNAAKFTEKGKISINAFLDKQERQRFLVVKVKDTGIGISADKIKSIFEEFSQETSSIEKKYGGSGLGLAISKRLTDLLKGEITVESKPEKGSEFTLIIPVKKSESVRSIDTVTRVPTTSLKKLKVLVVDDEPAQIDLISELLKSKGITVFSTKNGKEALKKLENEKFDLVLTDIQMPQMNGFQLISSIRKNPETKDLPVIALSGKTDVSPEEYLEKGFSGSILKPYSPKKLFRVISSILQTDFNFHESHDDKPEKNPGNYSLSEIELFTGGDSEALEVILTSFIASTKLNLKELEKAYAEGNQFQLEKVAHKMLPMFRQLKAVKIIKQLEILQSGDFSKVKYKTLENMVQELLFELEDKTKV